jgi:hypothetical protein
VIFCVAGFRPGSRAPFVSAKGAKTIDAPSGLITRDGRKREEGEPTRCAQTRLAGSWERPSRGPGGRRRTLGTEHFRDSQERARGHIFCMIRVFPKFWLQWVFCNSGKWSWFCYISYALWWQSVVSNQNIPTGNKILIDPPYEDWNHRRKMKAVTSMQGGDKK